MPCADLGYSPNFGARVMAAKRTNTIGAIIPTMENAIFARGLQAFQEELRAQGLRFWSPALSYRPDLEEEQIRSLVARGADGLLLIGHDRDPSIYNFLENPARSDPGHLDPSIRTASKPVDRVRQPCVDAALARKVIEMGHRHLAVISAETAQNDRARARVQGVRDAMVEAGLDARSLIVLETPYAIENGAQAFATLMQSAAPPTAILCGNDVLAVGALRRARELGIEVPGQVSITGFDDIELAQVALPALTTVHVPHREMGRQAARMLIRMVTNKEAAETVELKTELRLRDSLAPPGDRTDSKGKGG